MKIYDQLEVWFVTGSQHLYGDETLSQVEQNSACISGYLNDHKEMPAKVMFKGLGKSSTEILKLCREANNHKNCIGLIFWMHTFSPAKMWISGLSELAKPFCHLHTQFNEHIPWANIDMDFMNLNQSAHGGREFGHIGTRLGINRKVIVGHWRSGDVISSLATWTRAAAAWDDSRQLKVVRFGDNMRQVAVTEGNKVSAQMKMGYEVHGHGVGDLADAILEVNENEVTEMVDVYLSEYDLCNMGLTPNVNSSLREAARQELAMRRFLVDGGFGAFTNSFEDLHGMKQLPGIATQRLMAEGYGFGAEGDWKTAALLRSMKVMAKGLKGGTSFMEDYTYHFEKGRDLVLGAHMLELCPSIASTETKPRMEVHPLGIGGKEDPVRLVFDAPASDSINATMIEMGDRYRLLINKVKTIDSVEPMPKLPVARALWQPLPNLQTAATAWILAGGAHHTSYSQALTSSHLQDFADIAGVEMLLIDEKTDLRSFKKELRWNQVAHKLGLEVF